MNPRTYINEIYDPRVGPNAGAVTAEAVTIGGPAPRRLTQEQTDALAKQIFEATAPLLETARKAIAEAQQRRAISEAADDIANRLETATTEAERRAAAADAWEFAFALKAAGTPAAGQWLNALGGPQ